MSEIEERIATLYYAFILDIDKRPEVLYLGPDEWRDFHRSIQPRYQSAGEGPTYYGMRVYWVNDPNHGVRMY